MKDAFRTTTDSISGFTLLEVMVAMAIIAIGLTAVLGSQSQSVSLASEAKFNTTAPLLAQGKMSEIEVLDPDDLGDDSGDFGDDFPGYAWQYSVHQVDFEAPERAAERLIRIDLTISWGEGAQYKYPLRFYQFLANIE